MKKFFLILLMTITMIGTAYAASTQYTMRVDGLACPYCAYGIEKKLKKIEGVENIEVDLDAGIVKVSVSEGTVLTEEQMTKLFKDAGFTMRSMESEEL